MEIRRRRKARFLLFAVAICAAQICGCSAAPDSSRIELIGHAIQNYREVYGRLPPVAILDADGRPMHSWRVLVLPFTEANGFYDRYDFESPWDEADNLALASKSTRFESRKFQVPSMVSHVYGPAGSEEVTRTRFLALCVNAKVESAGQNSHDRGWGDGYVHSQPHQPFIVVELASTPVSWTEPTDIYISSETSFPAVDYAALRNDVIRAIMVDEDVSVLDRDSALELVDSLARESE